VLYLELALDGCHISLQGLLFALQLLHSHEVTPHIIRVHGYCLLCHTLTGIINIPVEGMYLQGPCQVAAVQVQRTLKFMPPAPQT
jgi:hypothetical protein